MDSQYINSKFRAKSRFSGCIGQKTKLSLAKEIFVRSSHNFNDNDYQH